MNMLKEFDRVFHEVFYSVENEFALMSIVHGHSITIALIDKSKEEWVETDNNITFGFRLADAYMFTLAKDDIEQMLIQGNDALAKFMMQRASNFLAVVEKKKDSE